MADPQEISDSDIKGAADIGDSEIAGAAPFPGIPAPSSNVGFVGEAGKQLGAAGKGLKDLLVGPGAGIQDVAKGAFEGFVKAPMRELLGQPQPGKSVLSAPQDSWDRIAGALDTFIGGDPGAGRMHAAQGDPGAARADWLTMPLVTLGASKLAKALPAAVETEAQVGKRANALTRAVGIGKEKAIDFPAEFRAALPEIDKTVSELATNVDPSKATLPDMVRIVKRTFDRTQNEFETRLKPIESQLVPTNPSGVPTPIADELDKYRVKNPTRPDDIAWNKALDAEEDNFRKPLTYGQLDEQRMLARDRIADFGKLNPSAQGNKMGSQINMAIDHAIHDATKNLIYDKLQTTYAGQVPPNYFRDLKRTQSALYNITDQLRGRMNSLSNAESQTFLDRLRPHAYFSGTGHVGGAIGGLSEALFPEAKQAAKNVQQGLQSQPRDLRPLLLGGMPPLARHKEPSLAPDEQ